ncbi:MAG: hypothetical protein QUS11_08480 [Candidatus Fermentibacter sp.]|nr:hypothetical protein [Candidatus Fermentibacter sp.]
MKKFALLFACTAVALMTGCEGDSPSGTGDMPVVTGVTINWDASDGVDIVIGWSAVTDAEGYKVWFSETSGGTLEEVGDVAGTTYTHTAESAGYYYVTAYNGDDSSSGYSTAVNTMPTIITTEYAIYDNYAPADWHSGFIFGFDGGTTGLAGSSGFVQDIYAYDPDPASPSDAWLYSGDTGPFGDGNHTEMVEAGGSYGAAPSSGYWTSGWVVTSDVIFCELFDGYYAKMIINEVSGPVGGSTNGTGIWFTYEIQENEGIRLFTTNS